MMNRAARKRTVLKIEPFSGLSGDMFLGALVELTGGTDKLRALPEQLKLPEAEIERYLDSGEPFDKAGSYGIQGYGSLLVKQIKGDYFSVVGLPVSRLARELKAMQADLA